MIDVDIMIKFQNFICAINMKSHRE